MRIIGIEGVQMFQGGAEHVSNMIVEASDGGQYRVPISRETYSVLSELGQRGMVAEACQSSPQPVRQRLDRAAGPGQVPQSLEDFARSFISGPNSGAVAAPPAFAQEQQTLVGELTDLSNEEVMELARGQQDDPLTQLRKVGFLGEPADVLSALAPKAEIQGSDVVESFEDTSEDEEDDPGEEYEDDGDMAEQF